MSEENVRVLLADDQQLIRDGIESLLNLQPGIEVIGAAENGADACAKAETLNPDLILMDIEMPEMNGMDLVHSLPSPKFQLVFQTAYSEYAVKAFEKNAIDYILKPFTQDRFNQSLDKCLKEPTKPLGQSLESLQESFAEKEIFLTKVVVKRGTKNTLIDVNKVLYFIGFLPFGSRPGAIASLIKGQYTIA